MPLSWLLVMFGLILPTISVHLFNPFYMNSFMYVFVSSPFGAMGLLTLYILIIKPTRCTDFLISQIYFWNRTLHVWDSFSVHHQESSTAHTQQ